MQPTHCTSDKGFAESRLGPERVLGAYVWQTFVEQGSRLPMGSDFPVERVNPFYGIHAAVTRQDGNNEPEVRGGRSQAPRPGARGAHRVVAIGRVRSGMGASQGGWYPAERVSVQQALQGFTLDAAFAGFHEDQVRAGSAVSARARARR